MHAFGRPHRPMMVVLTVAFAAHQGEEFVIALPIVMLVAAFFLMRWASGNNDGEPNETTEVKTEHEPAAEKVAPLGRR